MGWFFGFKLHLVVNHLGEIVNFQITKGHIADNDPTVLRKLLSGLTGKCFGDKGYLTKLSKEFAEAGLFLITKLRRNMKSLALSEQLDNKLLKKRGMIESVIDRLKNGCEIEHTRHRSPYNALANIFSGLIAYSFCDQKPEIKLEYINRNW